jgi:hypothetical protein
VLYDVYNRFIVDLGIQEFRESEIAEAKGHMGRMREGLGERPVLIICDRNYVSLEFMNYMEMARVHYLIRLHKGDYKGEVGGMKGEDEEVIIRHTKNRLRLLRKAEPERAEELDRVGQTRGRVINNLTLKGEVCCSLVVVRLRGSYLNNAQTTQRVAKLPREPVSGFLGMNPFATNQNRQCLLLCQIEYLWC